MIRVLYIGWQRFNEKSHFLDKKAGNEFRWTTAGKNGRATRVVVLHWNDCNFLIQVCALQ